MTMKMKKKEKTNPLLLHLRPHSPFNALEPHPLITWLIPLIANKNHEISRILMEAFKSLGSSLTKETDEMMMMLIMVNEGGERKWREVKEGRNRGNCMVDNRKRKKKEATWGNSVFLGQGRRRWGKDRGGENWVHMHYSSASDGKKLGYSTGELA